MDVLTNRMGKKKQMLKTVLYNYKVHFYIKIMNFTVYSMYLQINQTKSSTFLCTLEAAHFVLDGGS